MTKKDEIFSLPERQDPQRRIPEVFKQYKTRTEKARGESVFRNCRLVNRIEKNIDISKPIGLKSRLIKIMWKFVDERFSETNVCTWQQMQNLSDDFSSIFYFWDHALFS